VISGRNDLQKFMWLFGVKGSGKTQITTVLDALVGRTAEIGLDGLNDKWGLEDVYVSGVTLGLINDSRFSPRDSSLAMNRLLAITGDEPNIRIPIKHKTEVSSRLALRFHGTANSLPNLSDHTGALADRMLMLETTKGVRDTAADVKELGKRIVSNELGQVLRWAVEGLRLLNEAEGRFTRTRRADDLSRELARALSNVDQFLADCCETGDATQFVTQAELFEVWGRWATANKSGERMSKAKFVEAVKSLGYRVGQTTGSGRVVYGISSATVTYPDRDRWGGSVRRTITTESDDRTDPMRDAS
jgi:putative DNA primase/helicase